LGDERTLKRSYGGAMARDMGDVDIEETTEGEAFTPKERTVTPTPDAAAKNVKDAGVDVQKQAVAGKEKLEVDEEAPTKNEEDGRTKKEIKEAKVRKEKEAVEADTRKDNEVVEAEEEEVYYDEVRDVEAEEFGDTASVKRRRGRLMGAVLIVLVVVLIPLLYFVVIPRTDLTLKVYYNESMLNQINVDSELRNGGTVAVDGLVLEISVVNSTDQQVGGQNYTVTSIGPFSPPEKLQAISFRGDQYEGYTIIIDLTFRAGGRSFSEHWSHETKEPWMNQDFTETVSGF